MLISLIRDYKYITNHVHKCLINHHSQDKSLNIKTLPIVRYEEISGVTYQQAWDYQTEIHNALKANKVLWRDLDEDEKQTKRQEHSILFCEHSHVYTLGKSGSEDHLLISEERRKDEAIEYFKINRGGDITYHGPGQLTVYPIFDLDEFYNDLHKYVRNLEEVVIRMLDSYGIVGYREPDYTGVWIAPNQQHALKRKICAIGVHMSRWVSLHGLALNVNTDLDMFDNIVPCGIKEADMEVTSIARELGKKVDLQDAKYRLKTTFAEVFGLAWLS